MVILVEGPSLGRVQKRLTGERMQIHVSDRYNFAVY